jgi:predicted CXXCH cytochrome family protein
MSAKISAIVLLIATVPLVAVLAQDGAPAGKPQERPRVEMPPGLSCAACHSAEATRPVLHKAVSQGCDTCHEQEGTKHAFKLTLPLEKLCVDCHKDKIDADAKVGKLHPPVQKNECTKCHDPHGTVREKLLLPQTQSCLSCHAAKVSLTQPCVHKPAATDCSSCHKGHSSPKAKLLVSEPPELCFGCHKTFNAGVSEALTHKPVRDGDCGSCHAPHESGTKKLLLQPLTALCLDCHDEVKKTIATAKTPHKALAEQRSCLTCHDAHGGKAPKLLRADTAAKLCFECHKDMAKHVAETANNPHRPVANGDCAACHAPHGGGLKLLKGTNPETLYAPFDAASYGLCFGCHKATLVTEKNTTTATGFRNGDRNLHALHVGRDKGRTCRDCHDVHGAVQPKLIRSTFKFGDWDAPIRFQATRTGGTCAAACHVQAAYDRDTPKASLTLKAPSKPGDTDGLPGK